MEKILGKIVTAKFCIGGYNDSMIGLYVQLGNTGWGVADSNNMAWDAEIIKHTEHCKWTENERDDQYAKIVRFISKLLKEAKVDCIENLKDIPVECTFDGNLLKEWRILTEVL